MLFTHPEYHFQEIFTKHYILLITLTTCYVEKKHRSCLGLPAQPHSNGITAQPVLTRFFSDLPTFILLSTQRYSHVTVINMHRTLKTLHTLWCCPWRKKWMVIQNGSSAGTWLIKWNKNRCKTYSINDHIKMPNKNSSENADKALSLESR